MGQQPPARVTGVTDANGDLTLTFIPRGGQPWRITQVTNKMPGGAGALCELDINGDFVSPLVPTGDAAVGEPFWWSPPGTPVEVKWTGATAGAGQTGTMVVIYDDGQA